MYFTIDARYPRYYPSCSVSLRFLIAHICSLSPRTSISRMKNMEIRVLQLTFGQC